MRNARFIETQPHRELDGKVCLGPCGPKSSTTYDGYYETSRTKLVILYDLGSLPQGFNLVDCYFMGGLDGEKKINT